MIGFTENISLLFKIWKLKSERKRLARCFRDMKKEAEEADENIKDHLEKELSDPGYALDRIDERIRGIETQRVLYKMHQLMLPYPKNVWAEGDLHEAWELTADTSEPILKAEEISRLKALIRKDRKERSELIILWMGVITGIIVAIAALIAAV